MPTSGANCDQAANPFLFNWEITGSFGWRPICFYFSSPSPVHPSVRMKISLLCLKHQHKYEYRWTLLCKHRMCFSSVFMRLVLYWIYFYFSSHNVFNQALCFRGNGYNKFSFYFLPIHSIKGLDWSKAWLMNCKSKINSIQFKVLYLSPVAIQGMWSSCTRTSQHVKYTSQHVSYKDKKSQITCEKIN